MHNLAQLFFRGEEVTYFAGWESKNVFCLIIGDGEFTDSDGIGYCIQFTYDELESIWTIEVCWKDNIKPVGFDGSDKYITDQEIMEIKQFIKSFMYDLK